MKVWTLAAVVLGALLYAVALSREVYDLTSPPPFAWHVLLRKAYSVAAFTLLAYTWRRALAENQRRASVWRTVAGLAAYSALIEAGQWLHGSREGLAWNAFDTGCGALGGLLATADLLARGYNGPTGRPKT